MEIFLPKFNPNIVKNTNDLEELAKVYGYIGKLQINASSRPKLLFIKSCESVGTVKIKKLEHTIYKIKEILIIPLFSSSNPANIANKDIVDDESATVAGDTPLLVFGDGMLAGNLNTTPDDSPNSLFEVVNN